MLYVTTRDDKDAYTAHRTLHSDFAPDGGQYMPFKLPEFTPEQIKEFALGTLSQNVAEILNLFFGSKLNNREVELCIGRNPVKLVSLSQKVIVAEMWHNPMAKYRYVVQNLYRKIAENQGEKPTLWFETVTRVAFLFGIFAQVQDEGDVRTLDIAVNAADAYTVSAVWMAKKMGLPIEMMIVACDEGSGVWDILRRGVCSNGVSEKEWPIIEQIVYHAFGLDEVKKFLHSRANGSVYLSEAGYIENVWKSVFAAAVSRSRLDVVAASVMRTDSYRIDDAGAAAFGGLQDYRASTRENKLTLILAENSVKG